MNANELVDYLQIKAGDERNYRLQEAATMLRKLQAENEMYLRERNDAIQASILDMNKVLKLEAELEALKAHPVKELTDEEIIEQANHLADGWFSDKFEKGIFITEEKLVALVKAILRKAQEK